MPFISQSSIQEVKDRMDAVAVVSDYVTLEQRGGRWWACCPFHQEKTGSFTVNPDFKSYYCFGCHKGGTVINFIMEMDKLTFPEAIELLAKRFGVELVYENSGDGNYSAEDQAKKQEKDALFELYHRLSGTFHHFLLKKDDAEAAKQYIISRGISIETIEQFRLGYSPPGRNWLYIFLSQKGYSREFLASSGLFSSRYPEISLFSGRLMFPIADRQGRTVAFGGRFLPGSVPPRDGYEPPKYINSPELGIYKKGETLFAVDLALPEIRRTKTAYIAEGYMDVLALHQAGITNAVAPLGTAFTDEQAKLLKRWAEKIILFFDSDGAGQAAAVKAVYTCRKNGLACAIIASETGNFGKNEGENRPETEKSADNSKQDIPFEAPAKDPADILKNFGEKALQKRMSCFINDFDYLLNRARSLDDSSGSGGASVQRQTAQGKAKAVAFLFPYIKLLDSEVARNSCIEATADAFGLLPAAVADDYRRYASGRNSAEHMAVKSSKKEEHSRESGGRTGFPIRMNDELSLLTVAAIDYVFSGKEKLFPAFRAALEINEIEDKNAKELFIALEECIRYGETGMDDFLARISSPELRQFFVERSASGEFSVNAEQLMADGIIKIKEKRLKRRQDEIIIELRGLKKNSPDADRSSEAKELLAEKMRIDNELYLMKQGR